LLNRGYTPSAPAVGLDTAGLLRIYAGSADDTILVAEDENSVFIAGTAWSWPRDSVKSILIRAGDGDDVVRNNTNLPATVLGEGGDDHLIGGGGPDRLFGDWADQLLAMEGGNDRLEGRGGDDQLWGGPGDDLLWAGTTPDGFLNPLAINNHDYRRVVSGDFNGDGRDDLFFWHPQTGENRIALAVGQDGAVEFQVLDKPLPPATMNHDEYQEIVAGDFNGDGRDDLFLWHPSGANKTLRPDPSVTSSLAFEIRQSEIGPGHVNGFHQVAAGDLDGDGFHDLFFWQTGSGVNRIVRGGASFLTSPFVLATNEIEPLDVGGGLDAVIAADFQGDGRHELFFWDRESGANRVAGGWTGAPGDGFSVLADVIGVLGINGDFQHLATAISTAMAAMSCSSGIPRPDITGWRARSRTLRSSI
jgi:hypothetical protein